eukprot:13874643-Heterocapsa_arctica.AAC.1
MDVGETRQVRRWDPRPKEVGQPAEKQASLTGGSAERSDRVARGDLLNVSGNRDDNDHDMMVLIDSGAFTH